MREYTESYPTICIGRILAYPLYGSPQDRHWRAFDVHSDNQSSRLVSWVWRVQKGHTMTLSPRLPVALDRFISVNWSKMYNGMRRQQAGVTTVKYHMAIY